jgi:hypothetical protein
MRRECVYSHCQHLHLSNGSDTELAVVVRNLIDGALRRAWESWRSATPDCGRSVEVTENPEEVARIAKISSSDWDNLRYITMDEPREFSHYYSGPNACHSFIKEVAPRITICIAE